MEIPSLPTDSLYKFVALGGLVLSIASFALALHFALRVQESVFQLETEIAEAGAEIRGLSREITAAVKANRGAADVELFHRRDSAERKQAVYAVRVSQLRLLFIELWVVIGLCVAAQLVAAQAIRWGFGKWNAIQKRLDTMMLAEYTTALSNAGGRRERTTEKK